MIAFEEDENGKNKDNWIFQYFLSNFFNVKIVIGQFL